MRHFNGPSNWTGGYRWVASGDGYDWEFHDKPPIWGVREHERWMNGVPAVEINPVRVMRDIFSEQRTPQQKIFVGETTYKSWMNK